MKKHLFFLGGLLMAFAQAFPQLSPLTIGDVLPNTRFAHITNYSQPTAESADFTADLLILDFWNTQCTACIQLFPLLDSLQQQFGKPLQILLVNTRSKRAGDSLAKIQHLLNRVAQRTGTRIRLPVIYNNDTLDQRFPSNLLPHEVWIYKGKVLAITHAAELTAVHIAQVLRGEPVRFPLKSDVLSWDYRTPLFDGLSPSFTSQVLYRSLFSHYLSGVPTMSGSQSDSLGFTGKYAYNLSLFDLTLNAFNNRITVPTNRIIIQSRIPGFRTSLAQEGYTDHLYSYELRCPGFTEREANELFRQDLQRYFGIQVQADTQSLRCWVISASPLERKSIPARHRTVPSTPAIDLDPGTLHKFIRHTTLPEIARFLNLYTALPIVSAVASSDPFSVELPKNLDDLPAMQQAFRRCGLVLTEMTQSMPVIIVSSP